MLCRNLFCIIYLFIYLFIYVVLAGGWFGIDVC